ncbi:ankyrin [Coprinellus micaceus]|uniref:Ankyrin n=1 Tax=Coprinellus micaceus TaxID=71717 RepID=A0A4Y7TJ80_COPMI|nr:ankyrin [Coprinellus micaceus]
MPRSSGITAIAKHLLRFRADPNVQNNYGNTPLHCTCYCGHWGHFESAECLLNHHADPAIKNKEGNTVLQHAQTFNKMDVVKMLLLRGIVE